MYLDKKQKNTPLKGVARLIYQACVAWRAGAKTLFLLGS